MLSVQGLTKRYGGPRPRTVFTDVDLELEAGDYVAVMGESGIGKSTLLNLVAGLDRADSGSIKLGDIELTTLDDDALTLLRRTQMGFVFQAFHILPYLDVGQNVALPLSLLGIANDDAVRRVAPSVRQVRRASFPEASCNASRSPVRWSTVRVWCWPTSPPAISIPKRRAKFSACYANRSRRTVRRAFW